MCLHWGNYSKHLYQLLQNHITVFDEYPVEDKHSILRAQTKPSDTADELRKKAKAIFQSREKQSNFNSAETNLWNCTHFRHPTDEQLQHRYNLQSVHFELKFRSFFNISPKQFSFSKNQLNFLAVKQQQLLLFAP